MPFVSLIPCRRASLAVLGAIALCGPAAAAGETDFVKAALAHGGFKAFVGLVSRAGLADTLGSSPVTVFMPTDAAFARLSPVQRKSIADLSPDGVRTFVGRFVFPGTAMASNDIDKTLTSANGTTFDVTWYQGRLSLRDHRGPATGRLAFVVDGDIPAGPGMIDAVDAVLMPATSGGMAVPVAAAPADPASHPTPEASAEARALAAPTAPASDASKVPATPAPTPVAAPPPAETATAAPVPADATRPAVRTPTSAVPAPMVVVAPPVVVAPVAAVLPKPEVSVAAAGLRGWPLKVSGNGSTGKVNGVMVGLPDGRVTGLTAHFGGFLGFGGRNIFVPWARVTPDAKAHVLRVHMTAAEFSSAPASPPEP